MTTNNKGCIPAKDAAPKDQSTDDDSTASDPLLKWFSLAKNVIQRRAFVRAYEREERRIRRAGHE
jgi:hypothetical protein